MSGRHSRDKGRRVELAIVRLLQEAGLAAEKISRTGYTGPDLSVPICGRDLDVEVKARGVGFNQLYTWLQGRDLLIIRRDRSEPLIVLPLKLAAEIVGCIEAPRGKALQKNAPPSDGAKGILDESGFKPSTPGLQVA